MAVEDGSGQEMTTLEPTKGNLMLRTTQDRLREQLAAQIEQFEEIFNAIDGSGPFDDGSDMGQDPYDALVETPLEITIKRTLHVLLTCGGPHVEAIATLDEDGDITNARLLGHWGDALIDNPIDGGSAMYRMLEHHAEMVQA